MILRLPAIVLLLVSVFYESLNAQSVLANGDWYKIKIEDRGVCKLTYGFLRNAGVPVDHIDPATFKIYGHETGMLPQPNSVMRSNDPVEMAIEVVSNGSSFVSGDYILFYAEDGDRYFYEGDSLIYEHNIYSDENYYFLTYGGSDGKRLNSIEADSNPDLEITSFNDFQYFEDEFYNLLSSGRQWYSARYNSTPTGDYNFNFPNLIKSEPIKVHTNVMAQAFDPSSFNIALNGDVVGNIPIASVPDYNLYAYRYSVKGREKRMEFSGYSDSNDLTVSIQYQKNSTHSVGFLDYILVQAKRDLAFTGDEVTFRSLASLSAQKCKYTISQSHSDLKLWNITDRFNVKNQSYIYSLGQASFVENNTELQEYVTFDPSASYPPSSIEVLNNQNLKSLTSAEFIIITADKFLSQATRLANFRTSNDGLNSRVVSVDDIYNEFSGGRQDVTAIRDFAKYLYDHGSLRYLLLFGKSSYDYKGTIANNTNYVPIYESRESLTPIVTNIATFASDDYYGLLSERDGEWSETNNTKDSLDIAVGRIPVSTVSEAQIVVDKLIDYASDRENISEWTSRILFVADDGDSNSHQRQANDLTVMLDTTFADINPIKFFLDDFEQIQRGSSESSPEAYEALGDFVDDGALIVNYTGHGSENVWMDEQVLDVVQIDKWNNYKRLPLFVTATCEFSRHDDPRQTSAGERLLTRPDGGGIGVISTCRPVYSNNNFNINKAFYNEVFKKTNGHFQRIGDAFRKTKNHRETIKVGNRNFALLGDPTMRLSIPENTIEIQNILTESGDGDIIKAKDKVTLQGAIYEATGSLNTEFNGTVKVVVYDKPIQKSTLGSKDSFAFSYQDYDNALFRGRATVESGEFEITFIAPKSMDYSQGMGKIHMYAESDDYKDAVGSKINVDMGGAVAIDDTDTSGPIISLNIGDSLNTNLKSVSHNTFLIANLSDESGINISSFGLGNSLLATLDGTTSYILNDYFTASIDSYKSGYLEFPLENLEKGIHTITLRASDTNNNSSEATIEFTVADPNAIVIYETSNYPNPFRESTSFKVSHNRAGDDLEVELNILSTTGGIIFNQTVLIENSPSEVDITSWDGNDPRGTKLKPGLYLYRVLLRSVKDGAKNQSVGRLMLINY